MICPYYCYLLAFFYLAIVEWRSFGDCNIELPYLISFVGGSFEVVVCYRRWSFGIMLFKRVINNRTLNLLVEELNVIYTISMRLSFERSAVL